MDAFECYFFNGHSSQLVSGRKDDVVDLTNFLEELLDVLFQAGFGQVATKACDLAAGVGGFSTAESMLVIDEDEIVTLAPDSRDPSATQYPIPVFR